MPQPVTAGDAVADLHALLTAAGEAKPYVLVGHSYGGLIVRLYASDAALLYRPMRKPRVISALNDPRGPSALNISEIRSWSASNLVFISAERLSSTKTARRRCQPRNRESYFSSASNSRMLSQRISGLAFSRAIHSI